MNSYSTFVCRAIAMLLFLPFTLSTHAQGSLTPPGAPAPMMKTLTQVEPRIALTNSGAVTISQPGSYYLTTNITVATGDAITLATNDITLDLNGFTISSTAASATGYAINFANGVSDIAIFNGHIRGGVTNNGSGVYSGSGFAHGIDYGGSAPAHVQVSRLMVSGCSQSAIYLGQGSATSAQFCTVKTAGGSGVVADEVSHCVAMDCGGSAIYGVTVSDCRGECTGSANGVIGTVVHDSHGVSNGGNGIYGTELAMGCWGNSTSGIGVKAQNAVGCVGYRPGGAAIQSFVATSCMAEVGTNNITYKYNMP